MAHLKKPRASVRYSVAEWYGVGFESLSPHERQRRAKLEIETKTLTGTLCPFQINTKCNKKGGVCSIRQYEEVHNEPVRVVGRPVTTCPLRFLEDCKVFGWIGETILGTKEPIILRDIGFLDRLRSDSLKQDDEGRDYIGRIDNVLVHPSKKPLDWCALEFQAVYFSDNTMGKEFQMLSEQQFEGLPFPKANRRPDFRSSGRKRLLPQLRIKVPTIRTWGKKMAVVIDETFFESLMGLEQERHLSNAEIVWFVVGYEQKRSGGWVLSQRQEIFTKLEASVKALTGGVPLSRERFEEQLRLKLRSPSGRSIRR